MNDLVSIIMPSYNTADYISEAIRSVIAQTYVNWELIIVDDCSSDNTDDVISLFNDDRIIYIKNYKNSGAAVSRNKALQKSKGRWIAFLDSDDIWYKDKLEKQIKFMEKNRYSFSYTNYIEVDDNSLPVGIEVTGPKKISKHGMYNYCWIGCLTVMYDVRCIGLIQIEDIKKNNDYAMWLKVCKKANCYLLNERLAKYRRGRKNSISNYSYKKLIIWHYKLYRNAEKMSFFISVFFTLRNLFWGFIKKIVYKKNINIDC